MCYLPFRVVSCLVVLWCVVLCFGVLRGFTVFVWFHCVRVFSRFVVFVAFVVLVLQDPVAAEEGDKEASPEGFSPPQVPSPSPAEPPPVAVEPAGIASTSKAPPEVRQEESWIRMYPLH